MNRQLEFTTSVLTPLLLRGGFALLILLPWLARTAYSQSQVEASVASSSIQVKHVLGFEGARRNVSGELSVQGDHLSFQQNGKPAALVSITSIRKISLGEQDDQVGGLPMTLGKTAVPFGGGRVVSLFSHKKYDTLAIDYLDSNGGSHGAIFRLTKGQGEDIKSKLIARGAQVTPAGDPSPLRSTAAESPKTVEGWSVQVDRIDAGDTTLDPSFSDAIYENILEALAKSKQFKHVYRSGDRNVNDASDVLVLKTLVEKYSPGSETRRAVTTVAGATKLKVSIQLLSVDKRVVLEGTVDGNVRFLGDNLRATNKVAQNAAKLLKRSPLPPPATPIAQQSAEKEPIPIV
jgi:hypothetical protein